MPYLNDPFPEHDRERFQIHDTDYCERSCSNLRHEARVVNHTRLRFTIDMRKLYLWVC